MNEEEAGYLSTSLLLSVPGWGWLPEPNSPVGPAWKTEHTPANGKKTFWKQRDLAPSVRLELFTGGLGGRLNGLRQDVESTRNCYQFYVEFLYISMFPAVVQLCPVTLALSSLTYITHTLKPEWSFSKHICDWIIPTTLKPFHGFILVLEQTARIRSLTCNRRFCTLWSSHCNFILLHYPPLFLF